MPSAGEPSTSCCCTSFAVRSKTRSASVSACPSWGRSVPTQACSQNSGPNAVLRTLIWPLFSVAAATAAPREVPAIAGAREREAARAERGSLGDLARSPVVHGILAHVLDGSHALWLGQS